MVRKGKGQAMSYEEKEERDRVVAMLRSWEMCAVLGEEMGEVWVISYFDFFFFFYSGVIGVISVFRFHFVSRFSFSLSFLQSFPSSFRSAWVKERDP